ncbi:MAG TPA: CvpA family protein, partial [Fusicatenibacter saccharivorans]|nr:CvpA family protein [Fusicatenibacter saccharivorans]
MGTEFFWFYDVILAAILIGMMFIGAKKGFVRMVLRLCAFAASFVIALMISNGVSGWIYDSFISKPLEQTISTSINDALGDNVVTQLGKIDMEKAKI